MKITEISARPILASLGHETLEATIRFPNGLNTTASVPAGISAGEYEIPKVPIKLALEQVALMNKFCQGRDFSQESLDKLISGQNFGGNATLAVSAAFWRAEHLHFPLSAPFPEILLLLFEGGEHGNPNITIQEFTILETAVNEAIADFQKLRDYLLAGRIESTVGAEGGFSPQNFTNKVVLDLITQVFPAKKIALDAAGSFQQGEKIDYLKLINDYSIASIEDPYRDNDIDNWKKLYQAIGTKILIVGDDLTVTNPERIKNAADQKAINAVVIKPNQNGTITGTLEAVKTAKILDLKIIFSHRGEETDDTWLVDLAVAAQADYLKLGGMDRGERIAKYNRLSELGMK